MFVPFCVIWVTLLAAFSNIPGGVHTLSEYISLGHSGAHGVELGVESFFGINRAVENVQHTKNCTVCAANK